MSHYYLAPYVGDGTMKDPFRPLGSDQPGWSAIDLRPDASRLDGGGLNACLLFLPVANPDPRLKLIALGSKDTLGPGLRTMVGSALKTAVQATSLDRVVAELLLTPPANGWKPLQPHRQRNRYEIWLGGLLVAQTVLSGGSLPATDSFNRADESPIANGTWTTMPTLTGCQIYILRATGISTYSGSLWTADSFANDQYSQMEVAQRESDGSFGGPAIRARAATQADCYFLFMWQSDANFTYLHKVVNGALTQLAVLGVNFIVTDVMKIDGVGTTITGYKNGTGMGSPVTDSSITSGSAGLFHTAGTINSNFFVNWEGGNVGATQSVVPVLMRQYRARRD